MGELDFLHRNFDKMLPFIAYFMINGISSFFSGQALLSGIHPSNVFVITLKGHRDILQGKSSNWIRGRRGRVSFLSEPSTNLKRRRESNFKNNFVIMKRER